MQLEQKKHSLKSQLHRLRDREQYQRKLRGGGMPGTSLASEKPSRSQPHWLFFLLVTLLGLAVGALVESRVGVIQYTGIE